MSSQIVPFRIAAPIGSAVAVSVEDPYAGLWASPAAAASQPPSFAAVADGASPPTVAVPPSTRVPGLFSLDLPTANWRDGYYVAHVFVDGRLERVQDFCVLNGGSQWSPVSVQMKGAANVNLTVAGKPGETAAKAAFNAVLTYAPGA